MVITGFILVSLEPNYLREHWLHAKLLLVVILVALDLRLTLRARAFQAGNIELSRRECMVLHGAISFVFLAILILVLIKPFGLHRRQVQLGGVGNPLAEACLRHAGHWPWATVPIFEAALPMPERL
jgi:hypothetical protein